jgi:hypothetical protein
VALWGWPVTGQAFYRIWINSGIDARKSNESTAPKRKCPRLDEKGQKEFLQAEEAKTPTHFPRPNAH